MTDRLPLPKHGVLKDTPRLNMVFLCSSSVMIPKGSIMNPLKLSLLALVLGNRRRLLKGRELLQVSSHRFYCSDINHISSLHSKGRLSQVCLSLLTCLTPVVCIPTQSAFPFQPHTVVPSQRSAQARIASDAQHCCAGFASKRFLFWWH